MREIGVTDAKNKWAELLVAVEHGEEITITRRGKPVAKLVRSAHKIDRSETLAAVERMKVLSKGVTLGEGITLKELIEEGRR